MRGASQAHLFAGSDGKYHVVKFANNPLGPRVLVNEAICSQVLLSLGITVPEVAYIRIPDALASYPEVGIQRGNHMERPCSGLHFASALPCDPNRGSIYDFVPTSVSATIENVDEFIGAFVCDLWLGNTEFRQAVYYRSSEGRWRACFIGNRACFGGPDWVLHSSTAVIVGVEQRHRLRDVTRADCVSWLQKIRDLPRSLFHMLMQQIPAEWFNGSDAVELERLLVRLDREREFLYQRIAPALAYAKKPRRSFPSHSTSPEEPGSLNPAQFDEVASVECL
jgi:hypothetical protein